MTDTISLPYLFLVLGVAPLIGFLSWDSQRRNKQFAPKLKRYSLVIYAQIFMLLYTFAAAKAEHITLFPGKLPSPAAWIAGSLFVIAMLVGARHRWLRSGSEAGRRIAALLPQTHQELWWWAIISLLAGVGEECAYRGAAYELLLILSHSIKFSLTACVITFAVAHLYQGWKSAFVVGILGLLSHCAVFITGSLYLSISAHTVYDLLLGWSAVRFAAESCAAKTATSAMEG